MKRVCRDGLRSWTTSYVVVEVGLYHRVPKKKGDIIAAKRQKRSAEFKSKVAPDVLKGDKTLTQLSVEFEVSAVQSGQWKKQLLYRGSEIFRRKDTALDVETLTVPLYQEVGRFKMEFDLLKIIGH